MARIVFKLEDGTEIETELDSDVTSIGRHPESNVVLPSASVSSHHATIKRRGDAFFVQDLGTTNGTKLNGVEVEEAKLEEGDQLAFGDIPASFFLKEAVVEVRAESEGGDVKVARPKAAAKPGARGRTGYASTTYTQSSGCAGFLIMLVFLTVAFLGGLFIAHAMKHKSFLLTDFVEVARDKWFGNPNDAPAKEKDAPKKDDSGAKKGESK